MAAGDKLLASMKSAMTRRGHPAWIASSDFEPFATGLAMAVWNALSQLPALYQLRPRDYPEIDEAIRRSLEPYRDGLQ
jgi:hypothetical protein